MKRIVVAVAWLLIPGALVTQAPAAFTHARHAKLFPLCSGCHGGIGTADVGRTYPPAALCSQCHDGTVQPRVRWTPPASKGPGLLVFSHQTHLAKSKDSSCESCHAIADEKQWMNVARATPERCISCHAHAATAHLADGSVCATCHRSLRSAVALTDAGVAELKQVLPDVQVLR